MQSPADIFIDIIKQRRVELGISPDDLSKKTGIPAHSIKRWEAGGQKPRLQSAIRIAGAVGLRLSLEASDK